ncbi:MAG: DUF222 domain-containing protein [Ilumatobacteraceae bacterium]
MIDTKANDPPNSTDHDTMTGAAPPDPPGSVFGDAAEPFIEQFEAAVAEVCGQLHWSHARLVALTSEALEHRWWAQSGVRSPEHWLGWQTGVSPSHAARIVAVARRRAELPATMAAFDSGELSLDQVAPIVAHAPTWADADVCSLAKRCTVGQLRVALGRYPFDDASTQGDDDTDAGQPPATSAGDGTGNDDIDDDTGEAPHPDDPAPERPNGRDEFWSFINDPDSTWRAAGRLDPDHGQIVDAALREVADALFRESGRAPSGAEILTEMARRSLDSVPDRSRRDRYRIHAHLDERLQLVDPLGCTLPTWLRDLITCDASMAVTWTRNGTPIAQGSTADTIPAATRRHVLARDGGCRVPGCGCRVRLDLHHVVHRHDGGTNDTWNLVAICAHHHRAHHRGRLGITGNADDADGLTFTDEHGRPLATNRLIHPPDEPLPTRGSYRHPLGERLQRRWIYFNPPPTHPRRSDN